MSDPSNLETLAPPPKEILVPSPGEQGQEAGLEGGPECSSRNLERRESLGPSGDQVEVEVGKQSLEDVGGAFSFPVPLG